MFSGKRLPSYWLSSGQPFKIIEYLIRVRPLILLRTRPLMRLTTLGLRYRLIQY